MQLKIEMKVVGIETYSPGYITLNLKPSKVTPTHERPNPLEMMLNTTGDSDEARFIKNIGSIMGPMFQTMMPDPMSMVPQSTLVLTEDEYVELGKPNINERILLESQVVGKHE
jgi:hypothetical protein